MRDELLQQSADLLSFGGKGARSEYETCKSVRRVPGRWTEGCRAAPEEGQKHEEVRTRKGVGQGNLRQRRIAVSDFYSRSFVTT